MLCPIRTYRDKVCAHDDTEKCNLHFDTVDKAFNELKKIAFDFDAVIIFQGQFQNPTGPGIDQDETIRLLHDIL
jgi:hypothetical protein